MGQSESVVVAENGDDHTSSIEQQRNLRKMTYISGSVGVGYPHVGYQIHHNLDAKYRKKRKKKDAKSSDESSKNRQLLKGDGKKLYGAVEIEDRRGNKSSAKNYDEVDRGVILSSSVHETSLSANVGNRKFTNVSSDGFESSCLLVVGSSPIVGSSFGNRAKASVSKNDTRYNSKDALTSRKYSDDPVSIKSLCGSSPDLRNFDLDDHINAIECYVDASRIEIENSTGESLLQKSLNDRLESSFGVNTANMASDVTNFSSSAPLETLAIDRAVKKKSSYGCENASERVVDWLSSYSSSERHHELRKVSNVIYPYHTTSIPSLESLDPKNSSDRTSIGDSELAMAIVSTLGNDSASDNGSFNGPSKDGTEITSEPASEKISNDLVQEWSFGKFDSKPGDENFFCDLCHSVKSNDSNGALTKDGDFGDPLPFYGDIPSEYFLRDRPQSVNGMTKIKTSCVGELFDDLKICSLLQNVDCTISKRLGSNQEEWGKCWVEPNMVDDQVCDAGELPVQPIYDGAISCQISDYFQDDDRNEAPCGTNVDDCQISNTCDLIWDHSSDFMPSKHFATMPDVLPKIILPSDRNVMDWEFADESCPSETGSCDDHFSMHVPIDFKPTFIHIRKYSISFVQSSGSISKNLSHNLEISFENCHFLPSTRR